MFTLRWEIVFQHESFINEGEPVRIIFELKSLLKMPIVGGVIFYKGKKKENT